MIISSDNNTVIVGFLCDSSNSSIKATEFKEGTWVEVEGEIKKGNYHGDIPIIEIKNMKKTNIPRDEFVYPPSDSYISTHF